MHQGIENFGIIKIGQAYFVRTLSDHWVGRVVAQLPFTLVLEEAAWVASSGRLHEFMAHGQAAGMEVEYVGTVQVTNAVAVLPWPFPLLKTT